MAKTESPAPPAESPRPSRGQARDFARRLLRWYDAEKRDLPWRRTKDPYAILVSEFMLQQTQVATVVPYYNRFMKIFPTVQALAIGPEQEALRAWAGLGYYSRARNLCAAARKIVDDYQGQVPSSVADLLFLPGVGPYMAGAVASIAHGVPAPAVDANVIRVLCRLFAISDPPASPRVRRKLEELDMRLMDRERPGDFTQAMMELGARVCVPTKPLCAQCPVQNLCEGLKRGSPEAWPMQTEKPRTVQVVEACAIVRSGNRYLVVRRPADLGRYRNMWEFPHTELKGGRKAETRLADWLLESYGIEIEVQDEWAELRHQVTHHKITKRLFHCAPKQAPDAARGADDPEADLRWAGLDEIEKLPMGAPHQRILELLRESDSFFQ